LEKGNFGGKKVLAAKKVIRVSMIQINRKTPKEFNFKRKLIKKLS
jgi:hypothetical protein